MLGSYTYIYNIMHYILKEKPILGCGYPAPSNRDVDFKELELCVMSGFFWLCEVKY